MRIIYTILYLHILPLVLLRLFWRSIKVPAYRQRLKERFAAIPKRQSKKKLVWVHAVSVGETIAATPLVKRLMHDNPEWEFCITTTTPTGSERVRAVFSEKLLHYYLPYDLPSLFNHFLKALKPDILIIMETELWPNMIAVCKQNKIPVVLANGRMSARSMKGYQRFSSLTQPMLEQLSCVAAQSDVDADRFLTLGVDADRLSVTGSIKYDVNIMDETRKRLSALKYQLLLGQRRVIIFASTHPKEDEMILPVLKRLHMRDASVLGLVVPRHPERFDTVYELCQKHHLDCIRVSESRSITAETQVLLGDTMGDLLAYYGLASVAFVGGSLIPSGGHNCLEAAVWSLPIVSGPSVFNFQAVADRLVNAKGLVLIRDNFELERQLVAWLENPKSASDVGVAANRVLLANQGALDKLIDIIVDEMDKA